MHMTYTTNHHFPKRRVQIVNLVRSGWPMRKVARYIGAYL